MPKKSKRHTTPEFVESDASLSSEDECGSPLAHSSPKFTYSLNGIVPPRPSPLVLLRRCDEQLSKGGDNCKSVQDGMTRLEGRILPERSPRTSPASAMRLDLDHEAGAEATPSTPQAPDAATPVLGFSQAIAELRALLASWETLDTPKPPQLCRASPLLNTLEALWDSQSADIGELRARVLARGKKRGKNKKTQTEEHHTLHETIEELPPHPPTSTGDLLPVASGRKPSYAEATSRTVPQPILVYPKEGAPIDKVDSFLAQKLGKCHVRHIEDIKRIRRKGIAIFCRNENTREELAQQLKENLEVKEQVDLVQPKPIVPKVIIYNLRDDVDEDSDVCQSLANHFDLQNREIRFKFRLKARKAGYHHSVVEVPRAALEHILEKGYIIHSWSRHRLALFVDLRRCSWCQDIGHSARFCHRSEPTCARCARGHETKNCEYDDVFCILCYEFNKRTGERIDTYHDARNKECPQYCAKASAFRARLGV